MESSKTAFAPLCSLLVAALVFTGCGSKGPKPVPDVVADELGGAPEWVTGHCSSYWDDDDEKLRLCGVGSVSSSRNVSLARETATARGRTEIARRLQVKVESMLKDYQATTTSGTGFGATANDEQYVVAVSKQITEFTLRGTEPAASWVSESGTVYSLVVLDVEHFRSAVGQLNELSADLRAAVEERADEAFRDLDDEMAKR